MVNNSIDSNEEYKGPSRIGNAFTKGFTLGFFTSLVSLPIGLYKSGKNFLNTTFNGRAVEQATIHGVLRPLYIGLGAGIASFVGGSVWGWTQSAKSQRQHQELVSERNSLQQEVVGLRDSQEKAQAALHGWAERTGKTPEARFVDKAAVDSGPRTVGG